MIGIIKNFTNDKEYNNLSFNELGIQYLGGSDNNRYQLDRSIFSSDLIREINKTRDAVHNHCKVTNEEKLITDIFNTLYNNLIVLTKTIKNLETIYCLPDNVKNASEGILEIEEYLEKAGKDLDPVVYLFYNDLFNLNFESLLMFSHSLLDKFALYVKKYRIFHTTNEALIFKTMLNDNKRKKMNYYFANLKEDILKLSTANPNDSLLTKLNLEINKIKPLESIIIPNGTSKTLRNRIVHQESILGISNSIFAVYRYKNKLYKFDNFVGDTKILKKEYPPIGECIDRILKNIIYFSLNNINTILNTKYNLHLNTNVTSSIDWTNPLYNYEKYLVSEIDTSEKIKFNTFDIFHNGFVLQEFFYLKKDIFTDT